MPNRNGEFIMYALRKLQQPSSMLEISAFIAREVGVRSWEIEKTIQETLQGGVKYGFIHEMNGKYFLNPNTNRAIKVRDSKRNVIEYFQMDHSMPNIGALQICEDVENVTSHTIGSQHKDSRISKSLESGKKTLQGNVGINTVSCVALDKVLNDDNMDETSDY